MVQTFSDSIHIGDTFRYNKFRYSCGRLGSTLIHNVVLLYVFPYLDCSYYLCRAIRRCFTTRSDPNCFCLL